MNICKTILFASVFVLCSCASSTNKPIHSAADTGNTKEITKQINSSSSNLDAKSSIDWTPLMYAARSGQYEAVKLLIEHGADINYVSSNKNTALILAIESNDANIISLLTKNGAFKPTDLDTYIYAISEGNLDIIKHLTKYIDDINFVNDDGLHPLGQASKYGHIEIIKFLIGSGAKIDIDDHCASTALNIASGNNEIETIKYLINSGADINMMSGNYNPPEDDDSDDPFSSLITEMEQHKGCGPTPLIQAAYKGNKEAVEVLIELGADININYDNLPAFIHAFAHNNIEISDFLLSKGVKHNNKTYYKYEDVLEIEDFKDVTKVLEAKSSFFENKAEEMRKSAMKTNSTEAFKESAHLFTVAAQSYSDLEEKYRSYRLQARIGQVAGAILVAMATRSYSAHQSYGSGYDPFDSKIDWAMNGANRTKEKAEDCLEKYEELIETENNKNS